MSTKPYAIFVAGGKQYKAHVGDRIKIDFIDGAKRGEKISFDNVLFIYDQISKIGKPKISGAAIKAEILHNGNEDGTGEKSAKVLIFKKIRRHGYQKKQGHRQKYTEITVKEIVG